MREQCYVINKEAKDYSEVFNGDPISIPANGRIKLGYKEAKRLLGSFNADIDKTTGKPVIKNLEIQRIEEDEELDLEEIEFTCNLDGMKFKTQEELNAHLEEHKDLVAKDELAEERNEKRTRRRKGN